VARTLGIVLAGGRGERLGAGVAKAAVELAGVPLLVRAVAILRPLCDDVVVVAPSALELPCERALRVDDPELAAGPLAGLVAGLSSRAFQAALVLGVDLPLVSAALLAELRGRLGDALAVVPVPGGRAQPLAACYAPGALAPLAAALARGERALVPAVLNLSPLLVEDQVLEKLAGGVAAFLNVNTPADFARAERALLAARPAAPRVGS
jgi:molybdopterin-guanine dinucleotide biosynthesis protein A